MSDSVFIWRNPAVPKLKRTSFLYLYFCVYFLSGQMELVLCDGAVDSENCEQIQMKKSKAMLWQRGERAGGE